MKTTLTAGLAALMLAGSVGHALAQDQGPDRGGWSRGERGERTDRGGRGADSGAPQAQAPAQAPPSQERRWDGGGRRWDRDAGLGYRRGETADDFRRRQEAARPAERRDGDGRWDRRAGDPRREGSRFDDRRFDDRRFGGDRRFQGRTWDRSWARDNGWRGGDHRWQAPQRYRYAYAYRPPVGFYVRSWSFGDVLPRGWYADEYLIMDFWTYGLPPPPPGFDWVRVGPDALLISRFNGRVEDVVSLLFY